ncbi:DUF4435 domain-containing protein [Pseudarthrobacter oxydans]|uniref:DUF4435 domain-containing protein n=1 Tax=Pseudarthrobacter oxydans TaxID=1671 RepID=UPI00344D173D
MTPDSTFAWILMQRQVDGRLFLVVEGADEDVILNGHIAADHITVLVAGGKPNVLATSKLLEERSVQGALAVIDRDLDDLTGDSTAYPTTVIATGGYDLVSDILAARPDLLDRAIAVQAKEVVERVESTTGTRFQDLAVRLCLDLAVLRLVNTEEKLELNLRNFPFQRIIGRDFSSGGLRAIVQEANARSRVSVLFEDIAAALERAVGRIAGDRRYCGGHDLVGASAALLRGPSHLRMVGLFDPVVPVAAGGE